MPRFTRRHCIIGGQSAPDDWSILRDGQLIGRVLLQDHMPVDAPDRWRWSLFSPPAYPGASGLARSMEDALEAVKAASLKGEP
jgi:hypothetical protein